MLVWMRPHVPVMHGVVQILMALFGFALAGVHPPLPKQLCTRQYISI